jgi:hypothetical protein
MAVEIKSGAGSDLQTIDPVSKSARTTLYNPDGSLVDTKTPIPLTINPVTVVNNDIFASIDVSDYKYISLQLTGTWVGTVSFQGSNDNGTFEDIVVQNTGVVLEPYVISMTTNGGVKIPILFKFLRIRVTAYTSGSVTGTAFGYKEDANTGQISTVGTVNIAAAQTVAEVTNVEKMGGQVVSMGAGVKDAGTQRITIATDDPVSLAAGNNFIGKVSISPGGTLIPLFILGAAGAVNVNSGSISGTPATLRAITFTSYAATARHFKLYDTSGTPSAGSGTPSIVCSMAAGGTLVYPLPIEGFPFSNGIGYTMTLGASNSDTTPTATAPDFSVSLIYS